MITTHITIHMYVCMYICIYIHIVITHKARRGGAEEEGGEGAAAPGGLRGKCYLRATFQHSMLYW